MQEDSRTRRVSPEPASVWRPILSYVVTLSVLFTGLYITLYYNSDYRYDFGSSPTAFELLVHLAVLVVLIIVGSALILRRYGHQNALHFRRLSGELQALADDNQERTKQIGDLINYLERVTETLSSTRTKYMDLLNECNEVVIQFDRMLSQWLALGSTESGYLAGDRDANAIIEQLANPIRRKLIDFKNVARAAIRESERMSLSAESLGKKLTELKTQKTLERTGHEQDVIDLMSQMDEIRRERSDLRVELNKTRTAASAGREQLTLLRERVAGLERLAREQNHDAILEQRLHRLEEEKADLEVQLAGQKAEVLELERLLTDLEHLKLKHRKGKLDSKLD
jgi:chromosome segregation ATPase